MNLADDETRVAETGHWLPGLMLCAFLAAVAGLLAMDFGPPDRSLTGSSRDGYPVRIELPASLAWKPPAPGFTQTLTDPAVAPPEDLLPATSEQEAMLRQEGANEATVSFSQTTPEKPGIMPGMLSVDFDLSQQSFGVAAVEQQKPVEINGEPAGSVWIRIEGGSIVKVRRSDIAAVLEGRAKLAPRLTGEFVTLDEVRDSGIRVQYNAAGDRIALSL